MSDIGAGKRKASASQVNGFLGASNSSFKRDLDHCVWCTGHGFWSGLVVQVSFI